MKLASLIRLKKHICKWNFWNGRSTPLDRDSWYRSWACWRSCSTTCELQCTRWGGRLFRRSRFPSCWHSSRGVWATWSSPTVGFILLFWDHLRHSWCGCLRADCTRLCYCSSKIQYLWVSVYKFYIALCVLLFEILLYIEDSVMIVHQIYILQCNIFIPWHTSQIFLLLQYLSVIGCSLYIIALVYVQLAIEDIADHDEVDRSVATLVFHLVQPIDSH